MAREIVFDKWSNPDGTENFRCRAWVNFNGTGAVAIRASGNVSSITDNGTGDYTINFTNPMPDANYAICGTSDQNSSTSSQAGGVINPIVATPTVNSIRIGIGNRIDGDTAQDSLRTSIAIFR